MVIRPFQMEAFEYVVMATLRAQQLMKGCVPHLEGHHKATTMAQMEVAAGKIVGAMRAIPDPVVAP